MRIDAFINQTLLKMNFHLGFVCKLLSQFLSHGRNNNPFFKVNKILLKAMVGLSLRYGCVE